MLILVVFYHLMCFTPWLDDYTSQYLIGYSVIAIVFIHFLFSITQIMYINAKASYWSFRLWKMKA